MHGKTAHFKQDLHSMGVHKFFAKEHGYLFVIIYDYSHSQVDIHTFVHSYSIF